MEECGIDVGKCELLGTLDDILPGNILIAVTPFVVLTPESTIVKIDGREITDYVGISHQFFRRQEEFFADAGSEIWSTARSRVSTGPILRRVGNDTQNNKMIFF